MASDKKPSLLMGTIVPVLVLTILAGGGGAMIGMQIVSAIRAKASPPAEAAAPAAHAAGAVAAAAAVKELQPVVTNLLAPEGATVRLQTAIVYDKSDSAQMEVLSARIGEDVLAFVKTLTTAQLQGASGLQHLREDLSERASLRSDGRVREVVIEMLVVQ